MLITDRNFYVIKQSEGTTWNFSFNKNNEIIYKFIKNNIWSEYYVLSEEASKNFSVILLPNDSINVLYENFTGTIILTTYDGKQWREQEIIKNEKNQIFNIYFKAISNDNKIHIIFSILNKENNITTLFHEILDEENNLSPPKIIDKIKYKYNYIYNLPFIIYSADNKELLIMYEKLEDNHQLGYRVFNEYMDKWSNFNVIDKSMYPFNDYSMLMVNGILHTLYIKKEENIDSLVYSHGSKFNKKLFQGTNIQSCLISIICSQIWCYWIDNNEVYSSFSVDNGNMFSTPPYEYPLNSPYVLKGIYLSNNPNENKEILGNEIFLAFDDKSQYLIVFYLYPYIKNNEISNNYLSYMEYYATQIYLKILSYEKNLKQKDQLTAQLKYQLEEQKVQTQFHERKYKELIKMSGKFMDAKNELNSIINLLQESLTDKEERIEFLENIDTDKTKKLESLENINDEKINEILSLREKLSKEESKTLFLLDQIKNLNDKIEKIESLENCNNEKQNEIIALKDKLTKQESKTISLMDEIKNSKDKINYLNSQLTEANSKLNSSLFEKIFNK